MKYVIVALQWKLPRAPVPFNPALEGAFFWRGQYFPKIDFLVESSIRYDVRLSTLVKN